LTRKVLDALLGIKLPQRWLIALSKEIRLSSKDILVSMDNILTSQLDEFVILVYYQYKNGMTKVVRKLMQIFKEVKMTTIKELLDNLEKSIKYTDIIQTYQIGIAIEVIRDRVDNEEYDKAIEIRNKILK